MTTKATIVQKLYGGFAVVILFVVAMACIALWALHSISHENRVEEEATSIAGFALQIDRDVVNFRRQAREYVIQPNEETLREMQAASQPLMEHLKKTGSLVNDPEQRRAFDSLNNDFSLYQRKLADVTTPVNDRADLIEKALKPAQASLSDDLARLIDAAARAGDIAERQMLENVSDLLSQTEGSLGLFLFTTNAADGQKILRVVAKARGLLAQNARHRDLDQAVASYARTLDSIIAASDRVQQAIAIAVPIGVKVSDGAQALRKAADEDADTARQNAADASSGAYTVVISIALVIVALGAALAFVMGRGIARPIRSMTEAMTGLAAGDLDVEVPATARSDEIGEMARAVLVFKDNARNVKTLTAEKEEADRRAEAERKAALAKIAAEFEQAVASVVQHVSTASIQMQSAAQGMTEAASRTSQQSTNVAAAAEEASTNVETVSAAAEELSASISEISRQVSRSREISEMAVEEARHTDTQVQSLAAAASRIGEVVDLITDIASQTNLLALNATIEATRAGDVGRGFAVVAGEVKNLASQTSKATEEISTQIAAVQTATQDAIEAIRRIGGTIDEMSSISSAIAAAVEEQGAATSEIARNIQEASQGTKDVSANIGAVTEAAGTTGQIAGEVLSSAKDLAAQSSVLKEQVETFVRSVSA